MMEMRFATALFFRRFKSVELSLECPPTLDFENHFLMKPVGEMTIVAS
jgi:hypothetical protein